MYHIKGYIKKKKPLKMKLKPLSIGAPSSVLTAPGCSATTLIFDP